MTHYNDDSAMVRVDYFKPSGKWYMTEAVNMRDCYDVIPIHDAVRKAITDSRGKEMAHFTRVVLEPYHKNAHPVMLVATEED